MIGREGLQNIGRRVITRGGLCLHGQVCDYNSGFVITTEGLGLQQKVCAFNRFVITTGL